MKNIVKLENNYLRGDLINRLGEFVNYYNNHCYYKSLQNLTPADVYFGSEHRLIKQRDSIKRKNHEKKKKTTSIANIKIIV